jgi:uncharacterized membrane protein YagU involved in acid resistance
MPGIKSETSGGFVLRGLIAGAIGAWVMDRATWMLQDRQKRQTVRQEREAWPEGLDVSHALGYKLADAVGLPVSKNQPSTLGMTTHYLLSIGPAILYAAMRERDLRFAGDRGLLYSLLIFVLWDEVLSAATGVAAPPAKYPWQAHMRGILGHLALGLATHIALSALETDFDRRPIGSTPALKDRFAMALPALRR